MKTTNKCIESIRKYTNGRNYKHIITDDSSTKETIQYLRGLEGIELLEYCGDHEPHLQIVMRNAFKRAFELDVEYIVTIESDVYVIEGWYDRLIKAIKGLPPNVAGVTSVTVDNEGRLTHPMRNDLPAEYRREWKNTPKYDKVVKMKKHLTFCCTLFKAEACKKVDFCEVNRIAGVDMHYSRALREKGYELYVDMGAVVYHPRPHSSRREWRSRTNRSRMK